jgi:hypothetical protein
MDPVRNPYAPGAGSPPPELAGRAGVLADAQTALLRMRINRSSQSPILVGLRGVGKTVLLVRIKEIADESGFKAVSVEAQENKPLAGLLVPSLRHVLYSLSAIDNARERARRGLRVLKSFLAGFRITIGDIGVGIDPEIGTADSGDLESDLSDLLLAVAEAAKSAGTPVVLLIDELQYLSSEEFNALIMAIHKLSQNNLPMLLVGAGLPQILGLAGESKSYAERLFTFPTIGALEREDAIAALVNPAKEEGVSYTEKALEQILGITERYPYFLQQWAHDAWNIAEGRTVTARDVEAATQTSIAKLDESFFRVRFDRCTPSEKRYLRALAELGPGHHRSGDIAEKLGMKVTSAGPTRSKLISKGMIYSPQHGDTAFTVPLFDSYMRRVMPTFPID